MSDRTRWIRWARRNGAAFRPESSKGQVEGCIDTKDFVIVQKVLGPALGHYRLGAACGSDGLDPASSYEGNY
ncbi:hypothetical protein HQN88_17645 [Paenibacillus qinlingensis]|nr:hypothetical protein [Paenibacillus qinlingensis]